MKILFVCTGNICRSPMAEIIFKNMAKGKRWTIRSAGTHACDGLRMTPTAKKALTQRGWRVGKGVTSTQFSTQMLNEFDHIICMTDGHKQNITTHADHENITVLDVDDPFMMPLEGYLRTCQELEKKLEALYEKISNRQ